MMKQWLPVITILLFSCAQKQDPVRQKTNLANDTTVEQKRSDDSVFTNEHVYRNLSNQFDIKVLFKRFSNVDEFHDSCIVKLILFNKKADLVFDTIAVTSTFYTRDFFQDTTNVLSYATGVNHTKQIVDNYFGDIIVADLNFDNKDDVAVINDMGGNGGSLYSYFLQKDNEQFMVDKFLTDSMVYFPQKINKKVQSLTTYVHAGACCVGEHVYSLNRSTNQWAEKSYRLLQ